jgi:hypothetical protein
LVLFNIENKYIDLETGGALLGLAVAGFLGAIAGTFVPPKIRSGPDSRSAPKRS